MSRIKVDRVLLLNKLKTELTNIEKEFAVQLKAYETKQEKYPGLLMTALELAYKDVKRGKIPTETTYVKGGQAPAFKLPAMPQKPKPDGQACRLKRLIQTLELSKEVTISVDQNDEYLRAACKV